MTKTELPKKTRDFHSNILSGNIGIYMRHKFGAHSQCVSYDRLCSAIDWLNVGVDNFERYKKN